jgi:potassium transporter
MTQRPSSAYTLRGSSGRRNHGPRNQCGTDVRDRGGDQPRADHRGHPDAVFGAGACERADVHGWVGARAWPRQRRHLCPFRGRRRLDEQYDLRHDLVGEDRSRRAAHTACRPHLAEPTRARRRGRDAEVDGRGARTRADAGRSPGGSGLDRDAEGYPAVQDNHILHEHVVIFTLETLPVPHVSSEQRVTVDDLGFADDA